MKTKTIIIILIVVIVLAAGTWIYLGTRPAPDTQEPAAGSAEADQAQKALDSVKTPFVQGSKGKYIAMLQTALNKKYNSGLKVDGDWGKLTQAALKGNNLPTTIYWKEWDQICNLGLWEKKKIAVEETKALAENPWLSFLPALPFMPAPISTAQMAYMANYYDPTSKPWTPKP